MKSQQVGQKQSNALDNRPNQEASNGKWAVLFRDTNPCSLKELYHILGELGAAPRKRWGQNFLIDLTAQKRIAAEIQGYEKVWEIGPGLGALTQHLNCQNLTLFEIDPILIQFYKSRLHEPSQNCQLIEGDVCQTWQTVWAQQQRPDAVIGNLPYNSASLLLRQFALQADFRPECMVFTVQKEFAERLKARTGAKAYSSFSVLMQSQFTIEWLFDLGPQLFIPRPHVVSSVIRLQPRENNQSKELERFTRTVFAQRRKTIANNLKSSHYQKHFDAIERALAELGIRSSQRAQEVSVEQFLAIGQALDQILGSVHEKIAEQDKQEK